MLVPGLEDCSLSGGVKSTSEVGTNPPPSPDLEFDKVMYNSSLTVTRVSTGSPIEKTESQSPGLVEAPEKVTSNIETTPVQAIPFMGFNPFFQDDF